MDNDRLQYDAVRMKPWHRVRYRIAQFLKGLLLGVNRTDRDQAIRLLSPSAFALFERMPIDAQRHSLGVLADLRAAGYEQNDLQVAALLHDVGKVAAVDAGAPSGLWWRGPLVLAEALMPRRLAAMARDNPAAGWRYAVWVHFEHPRIGAEWAREAGCSKLTCRLIEFHQVDRQPDLDQHTGALLDALKWADGRN